MNQQTNSQNGPYNTWHDLMETRLRERELRQREHQEMLNSFTPQQRQEYDDNRRRVLEEAQRNARIWAQTNLNGRHRDNVISDEDERRRQEQNAGKRRRSYKSKKNKRRGKKRNTRKYRKKY